MVKLKDGYSIAVQTAAAPEMKLKNSCKHHHRGDHHSMPGRVQWSGVQARLLDNARVKSMYTSSR
jgi:hypothetical protein